MSRIGLAITDVSNCANSSSTDSSTTGTPIDEVPGCHAHGLGGYHIRDIELVAAFDAVAARHDRLPDRHRNTPSGRLAAVFGNEVVAAAKIDHRIHHAHDPSLTCDSSAPSRDLGAFSGRIYGHADARSQHHPQVIHRR